ncbi:MAG: DNA mismatch repair endonuclease MutL [Gemmataceae bacterium]|nr:DNA mismatch repair endonuclease MutL [Gemmataceae bacterium]
MRRILQLPNNVITKIAAGEVIERPASVVKELLENSLDAGSTRIDIDIEEGGSELIRVVDNGHGIHPDDLELAFSNHATSKLANADDLFAVRTMGFRGEALASIGGVAQVNLQSRTVDALVGTELSCHGSDLSPIRVWNGAVGTRIEVRHLFFNTPVRRKFLRTASTETGHICEIVTRIALSTPGLHISLKHNGKKVYEIPATADLLERIGIFFGKEVRDQLYAIDRQQGPAHLFGYIADPACERGNAKAQYLFLNGRWIRDRSLGHALQEGYRGLLMTGRYAVAFLYLEIPPDQVDVNVHPTKSEVRFRDSSALYSFILSTVRNRLSEEELTARMQAPSPSASTNGTGSYFSPKPTEYTPSLFAMPGFPAFSKQPMVAGVGNQGSGIRDHESGIGSQESGDESQESGSEEVPTTAKDQGPRTTDSSEVLNAIQLHNTYLVVETTEGMLVIDQHALHERVLFEAIKGRLKQGTLESQHLLIPEPVELSAEQAALVLERRRDLEELGLGVEDFGGNTVIITRYPALLGRRSPAEILKRVVDHLVSQDQVPTREQMLNGLMSLMACHAAVRSGDPLNAEEISALVEMRHLSNDTHHCPHGRPTALLFTRQELDRQFRRV